MVPDFGRRIVKHLCVRNAEVGHLKRILATISLTALLGCNLSNIPQPVIPGEAYRSRQLSAADLEDAIALYGIKSIVNLRGSRESAGWYDREVAVAREHGVEHYSFPMTAYKTPKPEQLIDIIETIREAPKPVLIHCLAGADRTGLVSALVLLDNGESLDDAWKHLSIRYGHVPFFKNVWRLDKVLDHYRDDPPDDGEDLLAWLKDEYVAKYGSSASPQ
jgi:protein tyrosine phosphatase (PTP) superfamily phosphohydrolase (DUF442 family)